MYLFMIINHPRGGRVDLSSPHVRSNRNAPHEQSVASTYTRSGGASDFGDSLDNRAKSHNGVKARQKGRSVLADPAQWREIAARGKKGARNFGWKEAAAARD